MTFQLGSNPRFPAASKKRGMARAIEVVEWMKAYSDARAAECRDAGRPLIAEVFEHEARAYASVAQALRGERP